MESARKRATSGCRRTFPLAPWSVETGRGPARRAEVCAVDRDSDISE
jgi:hypothetical protein